MTTILLFFVLGIVLLVLDLFIPGVLLSIFGVLAMLAGTANAFNHYGVGGGLAAFAIGMLRAIGHRALLRVCGAAEDASREKIFPECVNRGHESGSSERNGRADRTRRCSDHAVDADGQIEIDGKRHEALSIDGHVPKGARLKVTGSQNFSLTVTKL